MMGRGGKERAGGENGVRKEGGGLPRPYDTRDGGLLHGHEQALRCDGEVRHTHAYSVEDAVRYRSAHRHDGGFTNALGSEGAESGGDIDQDGRAMRNIYGMSQRIIHETGGE